MKDLDFRPLAPSSRAVGEPAEALSVYLSECGGRAVGGGLYRVHDEADAREATELAKVAFPDAGDSMRCFGMDWLGRQYVVIPELAPGASLSDLPVVSLELPSGEGNLMPGTFGTFVTEVLPTQHAGVLASEVLSEWLALGHRAPGPGECVGYTIPLFLGGSDEFDNFQITWWPVYWSVIGQVLAQVRGLPEGTRIGRIDIDFASPHPWRGPGPATSTGFRSRAGG